MLHITASLLKSNTKGTQIQHNVEWGVLATMELQRWVLDVLLCPEDWRWLWNLELRLNLSLSLIPPLCMPLGVTNAKPMTTYDPTALSISAPIVIKVCLVTPSGLAPLVFTPFAEREATWISTAQPLPLQAYPVHPLDELEKQLEVCTQVRVLRI